MTLLDISITLVGPSNSTLDTMMLHHEASHLGILPRYILPYLVAQWTQFEPVKIERTNMAGPWQNNLTALVCCELSTLLCTFANYLFNLSNTLKPACSQGCPSEWRVFRVCFGVSFAKSNLPAILKVEYSFSIPTRILMINAILYQHTIIYYKLYIQYLFNVIECLWLLLVPTSSFQPRSHCNFGTSRIRSTPITWGTWWRPWHSHQVSKEPNQG